MECSPFQMGQGSIWKSLLHLYAAEYAWLEKGYEDRAEWLLWLPIEPIYDGERNDPRFKEMVRKMGM